MRDQFSLSDSLRPLDLNALCCNVFALRDESWAKRPRNIRHPVDLCSGICHQAFCSQYCLRDESGTLKYAKSRRTQIVLVLGDDVV